MRKILTLLHGDLKSRTLILAEVRKNLNLLVMAGFLIWYDVFMVLLAGLSRASFNEVRLGTVFSSSSWASFL